MCLVLYSFPHFSMMEMIVDPVSESLACLYIYFARDLHIPNVFTYHGNCVIQNFAAKFQFKLSTAWRDQITDTKYGQPYACLRLATQPVFKL